MRGFPLAEAEGDPKLKKPGAKLHAGMKEGMVEYFIGRAMG